MTRIVTAREQAEMREPWHEATSSDSVLTGSMPGSSSIHIVEPCPGAETHHIRKCRSPGGTTAFAHPDSVVTRPLDQVTCKSCLKRQHTAVWRDHPWLDDRDTMSTPMDPHADIQTYLRGSEDAYDEYANDFGTWAERVHAHPPDPTPTDVDWFHATSADLPVGTVLAPHKGKVPWLDNPYHGGLDNRANWTWVEYDLTHSDEWLGYMVRDHGQGHLYRVKPHIGPFPWNGDAKEGWVTDVALVLEKVRDA